MPQSVFIQVGQCGNQIGYRFWDLAIQEYQFYRTCTEDINSFFKIIDTPKKSNCDFLDSVKARAILIDMEEGVVSEILNGPLKCIFDRQQLVTDVSGSGNNWAIGNKFYGSKYRSHLIDLFRKEVEECDTLQCFFLLHSMGGGTGSGLGTAILEYLCDEFPKIPRFVFAAFPSPEDDVITSPYNTVLANSRLSNFADCVFPFQNKALIDVCNKALKMKRLHPTIIRSRTKSQSKPFDEMNDIIANTILNLTCSSRFPGSLNVDINEIVMNMTPYPRLHYLLSSMSPLFPLNDNCKVDQMFNEVFSASHQLFHCLPTQGILLASALLCRGQVAMSDVQNNIERFKGTVKFIPWNKEGWKIGLCNIPNIAYSRSMLMLSNTTSIIKDLSHLKENFLKMYRKKAHLHHFLEVECMEQDTFKYSLTDLQLLIEEYSNFESVTEASEKPRLKIKL
ncbi:tubulin epsilon chain [Trichonephila clavata]|uniref:Tubulin epsilon chain n=1 Tax=Trichonephila clavata TaxID=2740835 RepID=A0A8X6HQ37_TRICU|nr:tubulin epsilon chain [Trichonephila clavata]